VYHPGGHFLPSSQKQYVAALAAFVAEAMEFDRGEGPGGKTSGKSGKGKEESLDDFPF